MLSVIVAGLLCIFMLLALSSCNVICSLVYCKFKMNINIYIYKEKLIPTIRNAYGMLDDDNDD